MRMAGRGVRYRLVTTAEDGLLIPYLEHGRFFINRELAQEYIDNHADLIDVIPYDDMVFQSMQKQSRYKREQGQKKTSGHDVNPSAMQKDLKSGETISIDGQECVKVDEWNAGDNIYVVGNSVEDSDFFYASVNGKDFLSMTISRTGMKWKMITLTWKPCGILTAMKRRYIPVLRAGQSRGFIMLFPLHRTLLLTVIIFPLWTEAQGRKYRATVTATGICLLLERLMKR